MKLYSYFRSSSAWRVRIALHYKNLPFEYQSVHLLHKEQQRDEYRALNPMQQVPTLVLDDGRRLTQSIAIIEYLEERAPEPPLLPRDPYLRGKARSYAEIINSGIQPFQNTETQRYLKHDVKTDEQSFSRHFIDRGLQALEAAAQETRGRFLVGDSPTVADVFLVPQLFGARRFGADLNRIPTLLEIEAACNELPAFRSALPENQPDAQ